MRLPPATYYNSLAEICASDGCIFGTGAVISATQIATCAHVVARILRVAEDLTLNDIPSKAHVGIRRVYVDGMSSELRLAHVQKFVGRQDASNRADIAVLQLINGRFWPADADDDIARFGETDKDDSNVVFVVGFPSDASETVGKSSEAEYELGGRQPNSWINAVSTHGYGPEIRPGFSGAPAWSWSRGCIVGLITEADASRFSATLIPTSSLRLVTPLPMCDSPESIRETTEGSIRPLELMPISALRHIFDRCFSWLHYRCTVSVPLLRDPPERSILAEHLRELSADLKDKILEKTYIPPPVKQPPNLPAGLVRKPALLQQLVKEIAGISAGGDAASAQISAISRRSRRVRKLIHLLTHSLEPLILLGEPGAGKSLTLQQASMLLAEKNSRRAFPKVVLYVPLGRWQPVAKPEISSVEDLVKSACVRELLPYLSALERSGRLIVVFDGLDEMSRERYTEHTTALSKYAESRRDQVRTLFSCRIADFSPDFQHKRLVLLPFEFAQVKAYLNLQFGRTPVLVDGSLYKTGALAKKVFSGELPFQARNPFVLSLLCIYIQEKQSFPQKRVDLLDFYYRYNFDRKKEEIDARTVEFWEVDKYYELWAKIALEITQRNQGTDVALHEVRRLLGYEATSAIEVGRLCGVLQQSLSVDLPVLRFEHHRAQEYFASWSIVRQTESFDWSGKLDVPRWQETLVNVAQMGGGKDALQIVLKAIEGAPQRLSNLIDPVDRIYAESLATERVELAVRIARDLPHSSDREELLARVKDAVEWFLNKGNAVSKVKMLRIVQTTPNLADLATIRVAISDNAAWVRDQAHVVAARLVGHVTGTAIPDEFVLNFVSGDLIKRLPSHFKLAKSLRSGVMFGVGAIGAGLLLLQALIFGFSASILLWAVMGAASILTTFVDSMGPVPRQAITIGVGHASSLIVQPEYKWITFVASCVLVVCSLIWKRQSWLYCQIVGWAIVVVPTAILSMWYGKMGTLLLVFFVLAVPLFPVVVMCGLATTSFFALLFGAVLFCWTRSPTYFKRLMTANWLESDFSVLSIPAAIILIGALIIGLFLGAFHLIFVLLRWLLGNLLTAIFRSLLNTLSSFAIDFPYLDADGDTVLTTALFLLAFLLAFGGTIYVFARMRESWLAHLCWFLGFAVGFAIVLGHLVLFGPIIIEFIERIFGALFANAVVVAVVVLIGIVIVTIALFLGQELYAWAKYRLDQLRAIKIDPADWNRQIRAAPPVLQARLINLGTPERLNVSADDFLKLLVNLEKYIRVDPALTAYGSKCAQILESIRQKRVG